MITLTRLSDSFCYKIVQLCIKKDIRRKWYPNLPIPFCNSKQTDVYLQWNPSCYDISEKQGGYLFTAH